MSFLLAANLKENFCTEGIFYRLELDGKDYECRGLAKISRLGTEIAVADALFVLVNPGSCQPMDADHHYLNYKHNFREIPFVRAHSDPTQYQIMRLMERMEWNMVYIINLSDLKAGNIEEFKNRWTQFETQRNDSHSIFSESRIDEITKLLSENTKIIAGWGTQTFMKNKMIHAISELPKIGNVYGLPHKTYPYYYHPFPMVQHKCIKWLDDICGVLEEADSVE